MAVIVSWLLEPNPTLDYNFVCGVYGLFAVMAVALYSLQGPKIAEEWQVVEDAHVVLAPFIPCLVWSVIVRQKWKQTLSSKKNQ